MRTHIVFLPILLLFALAGCQPISRDAFPQAGTTIPASYSESTPTGITQVDNLINIIATRDSDQFANAILYTRIPCSNGAGLGGPPACAAGQPEGTVVAVLPIVEAHLYFVDAEHLNPASMLDLGPLAAVYEAPDVVTSVYAFPELEIDWPVARYVLLYPHASNPNLSVSMLLTQEGQIMRSVYHLGSVEAALPGGVSLLYAPADE